MNRSLSILFLLLTSGISAQPLDLTGVVEANVFEVVVKRPPQSALRYSEELNLDTLDYAQRASREFVSLGTAFALTDQRFVTAAHVLGLEYPSLHTEFYLRTAKGTLFALGEVESYSAWRDYVVFRVPGLRAPGLTTAPPPIVGSRVYTAGNALGTGLVVREGLLTSQTPEPWKGQWNNLRFSAAASPGNSGGPLLDAEGRVLGVVLRRSEAENLNFALPMTEVARTRQASLDRALLYTLPMAPDQTQVETHETWPLPRTTEELRSLLVQRSRLDFEGVSRLLRNQLEPSGTVVTDTRFRDNLSLFQKASNGTWSIQTPEKPSSARLSDGGSLVWAEGPGGSYLSLTHPQREGGERVSNPAALLDTILEGYSLTRSWAGKDVRILSFGTPAQAKSWEDRWGRVWHLWRWDVPELDFSESMIWCPTPNGGFGVLRGSAHPRSLENEVDLMALADYLHFSYTGTLDAWQAFLSDPGAPPRSWKRWSFSFRPGKGLALGTPGVRLVVDATTLPLSATAVLSLQPSLGSGQGPLQWGPGAWAVSPRPDFREYVGLYKVFSGSMGDQAPSAWDDMVNHRGYYGGRAWSTQERTQARETLWPEPGTRTDTVYWLGLNTEPGRSLAEVEKRLSASVERSRVAPGRDVPIRGSQLATVFDAIEWDDLGLLESMATEPQALEALNEDGRTAVQAAVIRGRVSLARWLIDHAPQLTTLGGKPGPLGLALAKRDWPLVLQLARLGPVGEPELRDALVGAPANVAEEMVARFGDQPRALLWSTAAGRAEVAVGLLARGATLGPVDEQGRDALALALQGGLESVAKELLLRAPRPVSSQGWTYLHFAAHDCPELVGPILARWPSLRDQTTPRGATALHFALGPGGGWAPLLAAGASPTVADHDGWTPWHNALRYGYAAVVPQLLEIGPPPQGTTSEGWSVLHIAARYSPDTVPQLLSVLPTDAARSTTKSGQTALHLAVVSRSPRAIRALLDAGARPDVADRQGHTALTLAAALDEDQWVRRMLSDQ